MPKHFFTTKQMLYIEENCWSKSANDIGAALGISGQVVCRFMKQHGIFPPQEFRIGFRAEKNQRPFTKREDAHIARRIPFVGIKVIARELKRNSQYVSERAKKLGFEEEIRMHALSSRIKPGHVPVNKGVKQVDYMSPEMIERTKATRFQKGTLPYNTKERDGVLTIRYMNTAGNRSKKQYLYRRMSLGVWYPYHQFLWEKKNGKLPKGMCLWFKDGNTFHCNLKNLELITRAENLRRNRMGYLQQPPELRTANRLLKKLNQKIYAKEQVR